MCLILGHYLRSAKISRSLTSRRVLLGQEFKCVGCCLCWLCMKGFPERWIIVLRAVLPLKRSTRCSTVQQRDYTAADWGFFEARAISSSNLESNNLRIGDLFDFL